MSELLFAGRLLLALLVVLSVAVLSLRFVLPRLGGAFARRRGTELTLLEVQPLDRQHRLALVSVAGRRLLLGFGGGSVSRLASWADDGTSASSADSAETELAPLSTFERFRRRRDREVPPC